MNNIRKYFILTRLEDNEFEPQQDFNLELIGQSRIVPLKQEESIKERIEKLKSHKLPINGSKFKGVFIALEQQLVIR